MIRKVIAPVFAFALLGLAFSFNGCSCHAEMGDQTAKAPPPPEPAPPPPAPAPAPEPPKEAPKVNKFHSVGKATMEGNQVKIPGELEFDVDKATLRETAQSKEILTTLSDFMKQNSNVSKLRIEGHTDNSGTPAHNQKLSDDRAAAVAKWLSEKGGVDKMRLKTVGYGDTKPMGPNDTAANKQKNRRTEFHVEEMDGKPVVADTSSGGTTAATPATPATPAAPGSAAATPATPATPAAPGKGLSSGMSGGGAGKK